mmetsp:Transcript_13269/g.42800  ORF Transcript_13269/g.42800 Transcript_13269/m.42800 type:complete len:216 (+) Transcript_13269:1-648(+)
MRIETQKHRSPEARWWKFHVVSNWGSIKRLQVVGPLKLFVTQVQSRRTLLREGMASHAAGAGDPKESKPEITQAFTLETLGVDSQTIMLRGIARKHELSFIDIEVLYNRFHYIDKDGSGTIEEQEFRVLLMQIFGAKDRWDIPVQRLTFFWQQVDHDNSGAVDFEEFIIWFKRYAGDIDLKHMRQMKPQRQDKAHDDEEEEEGEKEVLKSSLSRF